MSNVCPSTVPRHAQWRSSEGFLVGVVSLAIFTVYHPHVPGEKIEKATNMRVVGFFYLRHGKASPWAIFRFYSDVCLVYLGPYGVIS